MKDPVAAGEELEDAGPEEAVGIGEDADAHAKNGTPPGPPRSNPRRAQPDAAGHERCRAREAGRGTRRFHLSLALAILTVAGSRIVPEILAVERDGPDTTATPFQGGFECAFADSVSFRRSSPSGS